MWDGGIIMTNNSNKIAVIYRTKYGSAKQYGEWIAGEISCDLLDGSKVKVNTLANYDTIVYIGSLYAVGILGFPLIKDNFVQLRDKKVIVATVGATPPYPEAIEHVRNSNFTDEMKEKVHYFHLRGAFDYKKLNLADKLLMTLLKLKIQKKKSDERSSDEIGMLASYRRPTDWTNKKSIAPILECINNSDIK
jgi:menaquinone-dependent protoporphyrinogen IX oxidase